MITKELTTSKYYNDKLSMFLRGCNGVEERIEMLVSILQSIDENCEQLFSLLDITKDATFLKLVPNASSTVQGYKVDILSKLGSLYGLTQSFMVSYLNEQFENECVGVTLTPFEFWLLIKARILQNYYDGSFTQMKSYYEKMKLPISIITHPTSPSTAIVLLNKTVPIEVKDGETTYQFAITENIERLFKAGYFTIKSMGIVYAFTDVDVASLAIWDSTDANKLWDVGKWGL